MIFLADNYSLFHKQVRVKADFFRTGFKNPLPVDKILTLLKLKAFAEDKLNVTQNMKFVFQWVENIVAEGENLILVTSIFYHVVFRKLRSVKGRNIVLKGERCNINRSN